MKIATETVQILVLIGIVVPLFLLWIVTFVDIARRRDLAIPMKGFWAVVTFFGVFLGIAVYYAMRPVAEVFGKGLQHTVPETSETVSRLEELRAAHTSGSINDSDYLAKKRDLLGST